MKIVTAIIREEKLGAVARQVKDMPGVTGLTVEKALGIGSSPPDSSINRQTIQGVEFISQVRIEIICTEESVNPILESVTEVANGTRGIAFVQDLSKFVRLEPGD